MPVVIYFRMAMVNTRIGKTKSTPVAANAPHSIWGYENHRNPITGLLNFSILQYIYRHVSNKKS
jgi:hypothetical protein